MGGGRGPIEQKPQVSSHNAVGDLVALASNLLDPLQRLFAAVQCRRAMLFA